MNTQVIDLTSEESSSTQRLTSFEASTEAAAVTPDTSGDAALAERLARKESARAKPNGDAPDTSGDADLAAKLSGSGPAARATARRSPRVSRARRTAPRATRPTPRRPPATPARRAARAGEAPRSTTTRRAPRQAAPRRRERREEALEPRPSSRSGRSAGCSARIRRPRGPTKPSGSTRSRAWGCGYRFQTLVFALRRAGAEYGTLASAGLAGPAASVSAVRRRWGGWTAASTPRTQQTRDRLRGLSVRGLARVDRLLRGVRRAAELASRGRRGSAGGAAAGRAAPRHYLADYFKSSSASDPTTSGARRACRRLRLPAQPWRRRRRVARPARLLVRGAGRPSAAPADTRHARQWEYTVSDGRRHGRCRRARRSGPSACGWLLLYEDGQLVPLGHWHWHEK